MLQKIIRKLYLALVLSAFFPGSEALAQGSLIVQGGSAAPSIVYLPMYIAEKMGFFKKENVSVDLRYSNGGPLAIQLVANGNADIAHIVWQPAIQAHMQGARGRFFYQTYTRSSFFIASPAEKPIKSPADLAGKTIGVFNMASPGIFVTKSTARTAGIPAEKITFAPTGLGAQALAALSAGRVDALALWDAEYANYEALGIKLSYLFHPTLGSVGSGGFYASQQSLDGKGPAIQAFSRAIAQATAYLLANPKEALEIYWQVVPGAKPAQTNDEALAAGLVALKFVSQSFDVDSRPDKRFGAINPENVQQFIDALKTEGEIPQAIRAADIIDNRFVDKANDFDLTKAQRPEK
jgi:NitT/TauT family transport system substrate-binding protein